KIIFDLIPLINLKASSHHSGEAENQRKKKRPNQKRPALIIQEKQRTNERRNSQTKKGIAVSRIAHHIEITQMDHQIPLLYQTSVNEVSLSHTTLYFFKSKINEAIYMVSFTLCYPLKDTTFDS
uniref:Uncharacterized protein n=1 Tax=Nicotiana tabacum TaxID=4097 RepID=A0A1S4B8P6_TOBAC